MILRGVVLEVKFMMLHVPKCVIMMETFLYPIFSCTCLILMFILLLISSYFVKLDLH